MASITLAHAPNSNSILCGWPRLQNLEQQGTRAYGLVVVGSVVRSRKRRQTCEVGDECVATRKERLTMDRVTRTMTNHSLDHVVELDDVFELHASLKLGRHGVELGRGFFN